METNESYTAFAGTRHIATGAMGDVVAAANIFRGQYADEPILVYSDATGKQIEIDLTGSIADILERLDATESRRGRGRPKMGVECSEICLLPRHWEWLTAQPRSASATIRRLIDAARKAETPEDKVRERIDSVATFMWAVAGDFVNFEEASRSLYQRDWDRFRELIAGWPSDIRAHLDRLLGPTA